MPSIVYEKVLQTNNAYRKQAMDQMKKRDVNALILFVLYLLGKLPEYKTISKLFMMLDHKTFIDLCSVFGGKTITIPTNKDMKSVVNVLQLYNLIDVQGKDVLQATIEIQPTEQELQDYNRLKEVLKDYDFEV